MGAVERLGGFGIPSGVNGQDVSVFFQADTGVREFGQLHPASLGNRPISVHGPPAGNLEHASIPKRSESIHATRRQR
ncbi:hypothetical protein GCM10009589_36180 [Arthrobacter pascens]